jgi:hypothetical protein
VSPIFVRPVREQLEHDRLIRHLQLKYKKKYDVAINVGDEQVAPVKIGQATFYPDLVLTEGKKLAGLVEVESGESVNNLEAMAQWVHFSRAKVPFHLYVPVQGYDAAKRLCDANQARVTEIWTYRPIIDGFDLVRLYVDTAAAPSPKPVAAPVAGANRKPVAKKPAGTRVTAKAAKPVRPAKGNGRGNGRGNGKAEARAGRRTNGKSRVTGRGVAKKPARRATSGAKKSTAGRKR